MQESLFKSFSRTLISCSIDRYPVIEDLIIPITTVFIESNGRTSTAFASCTYGADVNLSLERRFVSNPVSVDFLFCPSPSTSSSLSSMIVDNLYPLVGGDIFSNPEEGECNEVKTAVVDGAAAAEGSSPSGSAVVS